MEQDNICPICFDNLVDTEETNLTSSCSKKSKSKLKKSKEGDEFNKVKNTVVTLECRHKFHYECILDWFKQRAQKYPYSHSGKSIRICPYCRNKTSYIELPQNAFPIKHIHKEFLNIENVLKSDDYDKIIEVCEPYFNQKYCMCVLKTGKSKGQQCRKHKSSDSNFCHIHKKKYEEYCVKK